MANAEKTATAAEALAAAIEDACTRPMTMHLSEASFGVFADGSSWYWRLHYVTEAGNTADLARNVRGDDTYSRRARLVSEQWAADVARVEEADHG